MNPKDIKPLSLLKAMLLGYRFQIDESFYVISEEGKFCRCVKQGDQEVLLSIDYTIQDFDRAANEMSEEQWVRVCAFISRVSD